MTELLQGTVLTERQQYLANTVRNSGNALLGIINDILDFSKIEAGALALAREKVDIRNLMEDAMELFSSGAHAKGLELFVLYLTRRACRHLGRPGPDSADCD